MTVKIDDSGADLDGDDGSVAPQVGRFEEARAVAHDVFGPRRQERRELGCADVRHRHCQQFLAAVAEVLAGRPVDFEEPTGDVPDVDSVVGEVEEGSESLL